MIEIIYVLIATNLASLFFLYRQRRNALSKPRKDSIELAEFLGDLLNGGGVLHVKRVDPSDILIRSRRR